MQKAGRVISYQYEYLPLGGTARIQNKQPRMSVLDSVGSLCVLPCVH
jgi:hypothetical protein